jgi:hypothetical protein
MHRLRPGVILACAAFAAAGLLAAADNAPAGEKYRPQLGPQFTAGQVFSYSANVTYQGLMRVDKANRRVQASGPDLRNDDIENAQDEFVVRLSADLALAREVFKNGSLREAEFLVTRCVVVDNAGHVQELIPAASIIGARKQKDGQVAFAINGQAPSAQLAARLSVLIPMGDERSTSNDWLGPPNPMAAGAEWPVNEKAMLNSDLADLFPGVREVAGGVSFLKVVADSTGAPRGIVHSEYTLGDVKPPFLPSIHARPSLVSFKLTVTAPLKPGPGQYDMKQSVLVDHQGQSGDIMAGMTETDVTFAVNLDQTIHYSIAENSGPSAPPALVHAPAEPDAPPLPPGLSAAPVYRPQPRQPPTVTAQTDSPAPAPAATTLPALPKPLAPSPAPEAAPPPMQTPEAGSFSPFLDAQPLPAPPKPAPKSN